MLIQHRISNSHSTTSQVIFQSHTHFANYSLYLFSRYTIIMQNILFTTALLAFVAQAYAGGPEVCLSKGPASCVDYQVTKGALTILPDISCLSLTTP